MELGKCVLLNLSWLELSRHFPMAGVGGREGERVGLLQGVSFSFRSEQRDFAVGKGGREEPSGAPPGGTTRNGEGGEGDGERATKT